MNAPSAIVPPRGPDLRASFNRAAASYREHAAVQKLMAAWLAEWLPERREGRALELGAGPGVFTEHLVPWPGSLVATDLSAAMCAAGKSVHPDVTWRTMSADAPAGGPWNWIFSSSMLQWAAAPAELFAAWRRELAPGGRVLAGLFVGDTLAELQRCTGEAAPLVWRSVDTWREALAGGGLTLLRDTVERREIVYPSARKMLRTLHAVGAAPHRRMGPSRLRRLLQAYDREFAVAGGVRATWVFYRFEAAADDRSGQS